MQALEPFMGDSRLTVAIQSVNLGEPRNRLFLMQRAKGRYRIILGDDDLLDGRALSALHESIEVNPGFDAYLFGYSVIDDEGKVFEQRRALAPLVLSLEEESPLEDLFCSDLFPFWFYHPATFCFHYSLHENVKPNDRVGIGDDLVFMFDSILAGKRALILPRVLFSYRKFISSDSYTQSNQSRARFANVLSRRHIYYSLTGRVDLPPSLGRFIHGREFRRRFLYNSIILDLNRADPTLDELGLADEHLAEARAYIRLRHRQWFRLWLQLWRVSVFMRYFGLSGLLESANIFLQRRTYRKIFAEPLRRTL